MARTEAQIAASRSNGAQSRGPVTSAGKAKSALNATKHGLWSRKVTLITEEAEVFAEFRDRLVRELAPVNDAASELAFEIAAAQWRLERILNLEIALINSEIESLDELPDAAPRSALERTADAWQSLHNRGVLKQVNRQEATLRRLIDQLLVQFEETNLSAEPALPETPVAPHIRRNEPEPLPAPKPKRPTYDKDGRRIHYPGEQRAA
jgi:hypothetical protein